MKEQAKMERENKIYVGNIQRFSLHDGPGIRTTVFFSGCSIRCPWCANPEFLGSNTIYYFNQNKCCAINKNCLYNPNCKALKKNAVLNDEDMQKCLCSAIETNRTFYDEDNLLYELEKDNSYYGDDGGVTLSGGECLLHIHKLTNLITKLHEKKIQVYAESSLFVPKENVELAIEYLDGFIIDIKILDSNLCKEILQGNLQQYYENLHLICEDKKRNINFRIPLVRGYTYTDNNLLEIKKILQLYPSIKVELFSVHNLAENKYKKLGKEFQYFEPISENELKEIKKYFETVSDNVDIIKL